MIFGWVTIDLQKKIYQEPAVLHHFLPRMVRVETGFPSVAGKRQWYLLQFQQSGINSQLHVLGSHHDEPSWKWSLLEIEARDSLDFSRNERKYQIKKNMTELFVGLKTKLLWEPNQGIRYEFIYWRSQETMNWWSKQAR